MHNILRKKQFTPLLTAAIGLSLGLTACGSGSKVLPALRTEDSQRVAASSHMIESHIPAGEFTIMAYERVDAHGQPIDVFIEDDGPGETDHSYAGDPTPGRSGRVARRLRRHGAQFRISRSAVSVYRHPRRKALYQGAVYDQPVFASSAGRDECRAG